MKGFTTYDEKQEQWVGFSFVIQYGLPDYPPPIVKEPKITDEERKARDRAYQKTHRQKVRINADEI